MFLRHCCWCGRGFKKWTYVCYSLAGDRRLALRVAGDGPFSVVYLHDCDDRRNVLHSHPVVRLRIVRPGDVSFRGRTRAKVQRPRQQVHGQMRRLVQANLRRRTQRERATPVHP